MIIDDAKFLLNLGLSEEKAHQTLKNKQLAQLLKSSVLEVEKHGDIDKIKGNLIYNVVTKLKPQIKDHLPFLLQYISSNKIISDMQLNAALEYLMSNPSATMDVTSFDKASGIGVVVSAETIEKEVEKAIAKFKDEILTKKYKFHAGPLIGEVRRNLKWADGKSVKNEIDVQMFNLLGPKSDQDLINGSIINNDTSEKVDGNLMTKKPTKEKLTNTKLNDKVPSQESTNKPKVGENYLEFYKTLSFHKPGENFKTDGYVITPYTAQLLKEHLARTGGKVVTRFPPEPNGILHLGHAKAINIDFGYAKANGGVCYLRYDDTNPEKEEEKFFLGIEEMVRWLGYTPYKITHSSDYFEQLYQYAIRLIENGHAYVCHQTAEEIKGFDPPPSPWRDRDVKENLSLFEDMKKGKINEGQATLRMKTTLEEGKVDPVAYRIKFVPHHRTGYDWCIYPTYDFTHCLCDSLEDITHSLCTKEFQSRRSSYYWLCNSLGIYCPVQWEYGRLNVTHSVVSKRKIGKLIEAGVVNDWDDPRLYTLTALRRKGFPPKAINKFCVSLGVTTALTNVDIEMLESFVRDELNETAKRTMGVLEPLKVSIMNWTECKAAILADNNKNALAAIKPAPDNSDWLEIQVPDFPGIPTSINDSRDDTMLNEKILNSHNIRFGPNLYIEREDFKDDADKGFRRLTSKQTVGLRYANIVLQVLEVLKFSGKENVVSQVKVNAYPIMAENKPKAFIHWVSEPALCEIRLYDKLFMHKNPDNAKEVPGGFLSDINTNSLKCLPHALVDKYMVNKFRNSEFQPSNTFQFERLGYFTLDPDSKPEKLVFNRTVTLKETKK